MGRVAEVPPIRRELLVLDDPVRVQEPTESADHPARDLWSVDSASRRGGREAGGRMLARMEVHGRRFWARGGRVGPALDSETTESDSEDVEQRVGVDGKMQERGLWQASFRLSATYDRRSPAADPWKDAPLAIMPHTTNSACLHSCALSSSFFIIEQEERDREWTTLDSTLTTPHRGADRDQSGTSVSLTIDHLPSLLSRQPARNNTHTPLVRLVVRQQTPCSGRPNAQGLPYPPGSGHC